MNRAAPTKPHEAGGAADGVPHAAQNLAPGASSTPQFVQCATVGTRPVPQFWQNFAPAGFPVWQAEHVTPGGALSGCEGGTGGDPAGGGPA